MNVVSKTVDDLKRRVVTEPFEWVWKHGEDLYKVEVTADGHGYEVSAPRPLRALLVLIAQFYALEDVSAVHDFLYRYTGHVVFHKWVDGKWVEQDGQMGRKIADAVMYSNPNDSLIISSIAWAYTRMFGWWKWNGWDYWIRKRVWFMDETNAVHPKFKHPKTRE